MTGTETEPDEHLARAREAVDNMAWEDAFAAFSKADLVSPLGAEDLESWATTCYLLARVDSGLEALARSHQVHLEKRHIEEAARVGFWIVFMLMEQGDVAQASGWMSRSGRLVEQLPPNSLAQGYMLALEAQRQVAAAGEYEEGQVTAGHVIQIAREADDHDLEALALNVKGRALIRAGRIEEGMPVLDEAMVSVTSGLLSPIVVGTTYCSLIEACEEVGALRRAREWTGALTKWCDRQRGEMPFTAQCRAYRSSIFQRSGQLKEAEEEARRAYELYTSTAYERATGRALYQLAEVQRLRGELDRAEETYREAAEWGFDPQPGLALLRLAQGDADTAAASLRRLLEETETVVDRLRLLPVYVEVMLAVGDIQAADAASSELARHAPVYGTDALAAQTAYTAGSVSLARGDDRQALGRLREAADVWRALSMPYDAARARLLIGEACRRLGDEESAVLEEVAARRTFDELGVSPHSPSAGEEVGLDHALTNRELEVLGLLATGITNQEIANELYLSVKTVDRHVGNILTKLGVATRTAAVSYAYEHELVSKR